MLKRKSKRKLRRPEAADQGSKTPDGSTLRFIRPTSVRRYALDIAGRLRAQPFRRVGSSFLQRVDTAVATVVANEVQKHPSKGVTLL